MTTHGDGSMIQNMDNSLFSDAGTARSLNSQRYTNRSKTQKKRHEEISKFDEIMSQGQITMKTISSKNYTFSERLKVLSMPKQQYHGKDFFQRPEFRGLLLADHQEAIGERAFKCVDSLNQETVSKFNEIDSFKKQISQKRFQ